MSLPLLDTRLDLVFDGGPRDYGRWRGGRNFERVYRFPMPTSIKTPRGDVFRKALAAAKADDVVAESIQWATQFDIATDEAVVFVRGWQMALEARP